MVARNFFEQWFDPYIVKNGFDAMGLFTGYYEASLKGSRKKYGEYQNIGDRYRNVVGIFMNQIMQGKPMTVFGDGKQVRAFTYVGDIAPTIARSATVPDADRVTFNIGAEQPYSIIELARAVAEAMGVPGHPVEPLDARDEVVMAFSDHSKCADVFGPMPSTSLNDGLKQMAEWAKKVGPQSSDQFSGIEIPIGLPAGWQSET